MAEWPGPHTVTVYPRRGSHGGWVWSCTCGERFLGFTAERACRDAGFDHQRTANRAWERRRGVQFTRRVPAYDHPLGCLAEHGHMVTGDHVEQDAWLCERPDEVGDVVLFDGRIDASVLGGVRQTVVTRHSKGYQVRHGD